MKKSVDNYTNVAYPPPTMTHPHWEGERLKKLRTAKGWGYTDLVFELYRRGLRVAYNTLANWEENRSEPRGSQLAVLAQVFEVELDHFFSQKSRHTDVASTAV